MRNWTNWYADFNTIRVENMENHIILAVDDNTTNLQIIRNVLKQDYTVLLAHSGEMALKFVDRKKPDLILLDLLMPEMDGKETFKRIRENPDNLDIPVIFLTADNNFVNEASCLEIGASDYITKPIAPQILQTRIRNILELEEYRHRFQKITGEKTREAKNAFLKAATAIVRAMEAKNGGMKGHSARTADYSRTIASRLGYDENAAEQVYQAALLHDIGKVGIPDSILKKDGNLTREEYRIYQSHTEIGAEILSAAAGIELLSEGAGSHHECYDGSGYPKGLKGEEIPLVGRIIAVADYYDTLTCRSGCRNETDPAAVQAAIKENSGRAFDPKVTEACLVCMEETYDRCNI